MRVFLVRAALASACLLPGGIFLNAMPVHSELADDVHPCRAGTLYLALDTGTMAAADHVAEVLRQEHVRATFFISDNLTYVGDHALDAKWTNYWRARVAEGHAFVNQAWGQGDLLDDQRDAYVDARLPGGVQTSYSRERFCDALDSVDTRFKQLTGKHLDPLWHAPQGHAPARALTWAHSCGFPRHIDLAPGNPVGDEVSNEAQSNQALIERTLSTVHNGSVVTVHMGVPIRREPFAAALRPLLTGLKAQGYCFAPLKS